MDSTVSTGASVRKAQLARELGVSRQAIDDLVRRGVLPENADGTLDRAEALAALSTLRVDAKTVAAAVPFPADSSDADNDGLSSYHVARTLREATEAKIARLRLRQMEGSLATVADITRVAQDVARTVRDAVMGVPERVAPQLGLDLAHERILAEALRAALEDAAKLAASRMATLPSDHQQMKGRD